MKTEITSPIAYGNLSDDSQSSDDENKTTLNMSGRVVTRDAPNKVRDLVLLIILISFSILVAGGAPASYFISEGIVKLQRLPKDGSGVADICLGSISLTVVFFTALGVVFAGCCAVRREAIEARNRRLATVIASDRFEEVL